MARAVGTSVRARGYLSVYVKARASVVPLVGFGINDFKVICTTRDTTAQFFFRVIIETFNVCTHVVILLLLNS